MPIAWSFPLLPLCVCVGVCSINVCYVCVGGGGARGHDDVCMGVRFGGSLMLTWVPMLCGGMGFHGTGLGKGIHPRDVCSVGQCSLGCPVVRRGYARGGGKVQVCIFVRACDFKGGGVALRWELGCMCG